MKDPQRIEDFITEALAIEAQEAREAGAIGYMARALVQATLPHRRTSGNEFSRQNGTFTLSILAPSKVGLPYGSIPRLLIAWLTTEAVKTKSRDLVLGDSLSSFMEQLGLTVCGGARGDITRLRNQTSKLFSSTISCSYTDDRLTSLDNLVIADSARLWWHPQAPDQVGLFASSVTLSERFFREIIEHPVPVDLRALKALKRSPMALDIYCWLTYRNSYLTKPTRIPWGALQLQFGADYKVTRQFKAAFVDHLKIVQRLYRDVRFDISEKILTLVPSTTHVRKLK